MWHLSWKITQNFAYERTLSDNRNTGVAFVQPLAMLISVHSGHGPGNGEAETFIHLIFA
jgi:hypothetical protein